MTGRFSAGCAALAVVAALSACGASQRASTAATEATPTATVPASSMTTGEPRPLAEGRLAPGLYESSGLDPTVVFRIAGDNWSAPFTGDGVAIEWNDWQLFVGIARLGKVVDPKSGTVVDPPDDLVAWLLDHPRLHAHELRDRSTLAGLPVRVVEYTNDSGADVPLYYHPGGTFHIPPGGRIREYVMAVAGPDLVVTVQIDAYDGFADQVDPLLDSLQLAQS